MKTTVVVTTYNRPDALALTLRGFFLQDDLNFDVIVADDGSNDLTRQTVKELKTESPVDLLHVWHEDIGFRAAGIRNKAIRASRSDYLIFTDGDCVPRNNFVRKHKELAEKALENDGLMVELKEALGLAEKAKEEAVYDLDLMQKKSQFELIGRIVQVALWIIMGVGITTTVLYSIALFNPSVDTTLLGNAWSNLFGILLTNSFSIIGTIMGVKYASEGNSKKSE